MRVSYAPNGPQTMTRLPSAAMQAVLVISLLVVMTPHRAQAKLTCEGAFGVQPAKTAMAEAKSRLFKRGFDAALSIVDRRGRPFDYALFQSELALYRAEAMNFMSGGASPHTPMTAEAKLAFFEATGTPLGIPVLTLEAFVREASGGDVRPVRRALGKLDVNAGLFQSQIEVAFTALYLATHADPLSLRNIRARSLSGAIENAVIERAHEELARASVVDAFTRMGLLAEPTLRERFRQKLRANPNAVATIAAVSLNAFEYILTQAAFGQGFAFNLAEYSFMSSKPLTPALRQLILTKGIDAALPHLKAHYGHRPYFDLAWRWARRFAMASLIAYFMHATLPNALPPGLAEDDDNTEVLVEKIYKYWKTVFEYQVGLRNPEADPALNGFQESADQLQAMEF